LPEDLRVLGFDTSAAHCAAAVVCGDRVLARRAEPMAKGQAERLFPLIEELLAEAGLTWAGLDAIGVGVGPGNFTGIRISVAAARGLALSLGIPAVGVSATEAAACDAPRPCRAIVPLRGDEVVWEDFAASEEDNGPVVEGADSQDTAHPALATRSLPHIEGQAAEPLCRADATPASRRGPALGKTGALPDGPAACEAVHPAAVAIALVATRRVAATCDGIAAQVVAEEDRGRPRLLRLAGLRLPRPSPLYLRPADAAPPRDPAPKILP